MHDARGACVREHGGMRRSELPSELLLAPARTAEALAAGVSPGRLRCADIAHPFHGVVVAGEAPRELLERCHAYAARLAPGQFFSHRTALRLFGAPLPTRSRGEPLDVGVLDPRTPPRARGVRGHRLSEVDLRLMDGLPVLAPSDAWCYAASSLGRRDAVAVGDFLVSRRRRSPRIAPWCTPADLASAAARHAGKRGAQTVGWALPRVRVGVDSRPETHLRLLLVAARLPGPVIGLEIADAEGTMHPDLAYPRERIAFEYEGDVHRTDRATWMRDLTRRERMEAAGWRVIRVTAADVFAHPDALVARVRRILASR